MAITKSTAEQCNAAQVAYRKWAKANKKKAITTCELRNRWLEQHGRPQHRVSAAEINNL